MVCDAVSCVIDDHNMRSMIDDALRVMQDA